MTADETAEARTAELTTERRRLLGRAHRMLSSRAGADDVVTSSPN